jgi:hypothetical protein
MQSGAVPNVDRTSTANAGTCGVRSGTHREVTLMWMKNNILVVFSVGHRGWKPKSHRCQNLCQCHPELQVQLIRIVHMKSREDRSQKTVLYALMRYRTSTTLSGAVANVARMYTPIVGIDGAGNVAQTGVLQV